ncbi:unnamed protein product [marine sediment metagenome]|uniref:Uncharacterized protein n=1 Tax=marine sediment metagenome TaxID=412755 RepID=X1S6N7_9ZZZZ
MNKSEKYYDEVNLYPKSTYPRNDGTTTRMFAIRLTEEEIETWKSMKLSKTIHGILAGEDKSNDSIKISALKNYLKGLYDIMVNKMNAKIILDQNEKDLLIKIYEVVGNE